MNAAATQTTEMTGKTSQTNANGVPVETGDRVTFTRADVRRLGKVRYYGSQAATYFVVELCDGRVVFLIRVSDQPTADQAWLKKIARKFDAGQARRNPGYSLVWGEDL